MTIRAVALDLGNTLVEYYEREDFRPILSESIRHAHDAFSHFAGIDLEEAQLIAASENHEHDDGKVRPLQDRFDRVFGLRDDTPSSVREQAGRAFLRPIFGRARKYEDTDLTLQALRDLGCKLAIVSNTPWGSPSEPWREELRRLDLIDATDVSIFCVDIGWRKPSPKIFAHVLAVLNVDPTECLFVGDEPVWDIGGALGAGMHAVLMDRTNRNTTYPGPKITRLVEIIHFVQRSFCARR